MEREGLKIMEVSEDADMDGIVESDIRSIQVVSAEENLVEDFLCKIENLDVEGKKAAFNELRESNPELALAVKERMVQESRVRNGQNKKLVEISKGLRAGSVSEISAVVRGQVNASGVIGELVKRSA